MSEGVIRWGIIGPGKIAHNFVEGMREVRGAELYAVASSSFERADDFAHRYGAQKVYDSYLSLVQDPLVDVVYVATTNNFHYEHAKLCLEHKKACLCEKPFTLTVAELEDLIAIARRNNTFLMEALWTRFLPSIMSVENLIRQGVIGTIQKIEANFGFDVQYDSNSRLFNPRLGGGALYDIGIYPVFFAMHFLGVPHNISAQAQKSPTGVDVENEIVFEYPGGVRAYLSSSFARNLPCEAVLYGTKATVKFARMWHCPTQISLQVQNMHKDITPQYIGNGYNYEIQEVHNCVLQNRKESMFLSLENSLQRMKILNKILSFW